MGKMLWASPAILPNPAFSVRPGLDRSLDWAGELGTRVVNQPNKRSRPWAVPVPRYCWPKEAQAKTRMPRTYPQGSVDLSITVLRGRDTGSRKEECR